VKERFATSDGRTLAYRRDGSGPTLVGHPGGPGFSGDHFGDLGGLSGSFELIVLDPRGTGESSRPDDPHAYRTEDYAADLDELRNHLGLGEIDLFGHSHGGVVAMAYAADHPERIRRLVLSSTLARFAAEQEREMEAAMEARSGEPWFEDAKAAVEAEQAGNFASEAELGALWKREAPLYFARFGEREHAWLEAYGDLPLNAAALKHFNDEIFPAFDLRPRLAEIRAPTLVVTGEEDFICGPASAREIAAGIPEARLCLLPGLGHMTFVEDPDAFREPVAEFLRG
jgi:pimeloyl-ACP methyl ester carboxylesterase